jgi:DNA-binding PadR family transcriptional regulator
MLNQQGFPVLETLFKAWFIEAHVTHPGNRQVFSSYTLNQQGFPTLETLFKAWSPVYSLGE